MEENVREAGASHVRVMTEAERENYEGITLDQSPDGAAEHRAKADERERMRIVFEQGDAKSVRDELLRHFLGRYWKLKLIGFGTAIVLAVFLFLVALPALSVLLVVGGLVFLLSQLFRS